jgi:ring-1,2-phenylacetyl-CoA epoxidase subunit PaaD
MPNGKIMETKAVNETHIWEWLHQIPDPEIPVISIVDLGVVRKVELNDNEVIVYITPTYTGCPAMNIFEADILSMLKEKGFKNPMIRTVWSPPWTTDWLSDEALEKLRVYGIAPPVKGSEDKGILFSSGPKTVACPKCGSDDTKVISQFGSTACKALYSCNSCKEPFEYFKCI